MEVDQGAVSVTEFSDGDRIRCIVGDAFISEGDLGTVVAIRYGLSPRAYVRWDNDCTSIIDPTHFEVVKAAA